MFDVMADWLTVPLLHQEGGKPPHRIGMAHPSIAPYGLFTARDGKQILLSIQSDREWRKFAEVFLGDAAYGADPRFATNVARVTNREQTDALVAEAFAFMGEEEARDRLVTADVAFAGLNDMAALSAHPHLRRIEVDTPAGPVAFPAPAPRLMGEARSYRSVPALGSQPEENET
jgi:crotonobetainyl-CoA:carnitine CoA-transferase CaiB-like acyl-CoA transferase